MFLRFPSFVLNLVLAVDVPFVLTTSIVLDKTSAHRDRQTDGEIERQRDRELLWHGYKKNDPGGSAWSCKMKMCTYEQIGKSIIIIMIYQIKYR